METDEREEGESRCDVVTLERCNWNLLERDGSVSLLILVDRDAFVSP